MAKVIFLSATLQRSFQAPRKWHNDVSGLSAGALHLEVRSGDTKQVVTCSKLPVLNKLPGARHRVSSRGRRS